MKTYYDAEGNHTLYLDSRGRLVAWHCEGPEEGGASAGVNSGIVAELLDADAKARADEFSGKPLAFDSVWGRTAHAEDGEEICYAEIYWTAGRLCYETIHRITPDGFKPAVPAALRSRISDSERADLDSGVAALVRAIG